jgi:hypothetical protein
LNAQLGRSWSELLIESQKVLAIFWLDATARTYETIKFDRIFHGKNLILAVYKVLMKEGAWC